MQEFFDVKFFSLAKEVLFILVLKMGIMEKIVISRIGGHLVSLGWSHNSSTRTGGRSSSEVGSLKIESE